jgi:hypothetical protein
VLKIPFSLIRIFILNPKMKVSIISTIVATLLAASSAAPFDTSCQSQIDALRVWEVTAIFHGAGGSHFTQKFQNDGWIYPIKNPLVVESITVFGPGFAGCKFTGILGSHTEAGNGSPGYVHPPQRQIFGSCTA